ncbi:MAG: two-component system response regulator CreB, partial [Verrucomicrobiota bacterium]
VLIVEDEPSIAETLVYSLETEGFETHHVLTGGEAISSLRENGSDFVVLDVGLPDMLGFDVCREIRKFSDVPILFLTARESEIDRVVGLELGADDYVVKPFSPRELTARVHAILRRSQRTRSDQANSSASPSGVIYGPLTLRPDRFQALLEDVDLGLSRYEYGMLALFVKHPGRVYSREQLMNQIWDEPDSASDRTVDAHIKTLRRKLHEVQPECDLIVTHRGLGYSISEVSA